MKHRWKMRRWWQTLWCRVIRNGNTQTCARCGSKLMSVREPGGKGGRLKLVTYFTPSGVDSLRHVVRRIPPCFSSRR